MKRRKITLATIVAAAMLSVGVPAQARDVDAFNVNEVGQVAPSLVLYSQGVLRNLWERPELARRDRSLVTLSALIARAQTVNCPTTLVRHSITRSLPARFPRSLRISRFMRAVRMH